MGPPTEKFEILGSEKCILVDSGDGFAMNNRESKGSKKPVRSDRGSGPPDPPSVSATTNVMFIKQYSCLGKAVDNSR